MFDRLPKDINNLIFSELNLVQLSNAARTCRFFNNALQLRLKKYLGQYQAIPDLEMFEEIFTIFKYNNHYFAILDNIKFYQYYQSRQKPNDLLLAFKKITNDIYHHENADYPLYLYSSDGASFHLMRNDRRVEEELCQSCKTDNLFFATNDSEVNFRCNIITNEESALLINPDSDQGKVEVLAEYKKLTRSAKQKIIISLLIEGFHALRPVPRGESPQTLYKFNSRNEYILITQLSGTMGCGSAYFVSEHEKLKLEVKSVRISFETGRNSTVFRVNSCYKEIYSEHHDGDKSYLLTLNDEKHELCKIDLHKFDLAQLQITLPGPGHFNTMLDAFPEHSNRENETPVSNSCVCM